ncbi:flagellar motor protein MotB [Acerihabitans sp. KWT182]|uniref:Flagellar motor protein MotB n=1 Tax=Acerihabitans sp. KWT182 TaxID=3157919 RepID=A0AAU7Q5H3_9GAMM
MKNQPVVVVRKRRPSAGHGAHGGAWKIAYADFMTAMMAFFLVMWLLSIASPQDLTSIAEYFRTPLNVAITGGPKSSTDSSPIPGGGDDPTRQQGDVHKSLDNLMQKLEKKRLNQLRERLDQLIESDPRLRVLRPQLLINLVQEGLQIQILDSQNRPMFETGSALVEPYMRDVLRGIAPILNDIPNKISISGHTDAAPYANGERGYSNWELSADRANASRRELITGGLAEGKILRVVGMSSTMSIAPKQPFAAINRRISLVVLNKQTEEMIEHENAQNPMVEINQSKELSTQPEFKAAANAGNGAAAPAVQPATPAVGGAAPAVQPATPAVGGAAPAVQPVTPAVGGAAPAVQPATPAVGGAAPAIQPATPAVGGVAPAVQPATPAAGGAASSVQPATPAAGVKVHAAAPRITTAIPPAPDAVPAAPANPKGAPATPAAGARAGLER